MTRQLMWALLAVMAVSCSSNGHYSNSRQGVPECGSMTGCEYAEKTTEETTEGRDQPAGVRLFDLSDIEWEIYNKSGLPPFLDPEGVEPYLDRPLYLTRVKASRDYIEPFDLDPPEPGTEVRLVVPRVKFPTLFSKAFAMDVECAVKSFGTTDDIIERQLRLYQGATEPYRPDTFLGRVSEAHGFQSRPYDDSVSWFWWPSNLGAFSLNAVSGMRITSAPRPRAVERNDLLLAHRKGLSIEFTDTTDLTAGGQHSLAMLVWWKLGDYAGVSTLEDTTAVLLLTEQLVFRYRTIEVEVKEASAEEGLLLDVRTYRLVNPKARD